MESGKKKGHFGAIRLVLATMLALLAIPAAAASADVVSNPGSFDVSITGGSLQIGNLPDNDITDFGSPTLSGTVDAAGAVAVPSAGIDFPGKSRTTLEVAGNPVSVDVSILAAGDATGTIDPDAGSLDLSLPVKILVEGADGSPDFGPDCMAGSDLNPITLALTSGVSAGSNPISGTPFNQEDGTGKIVDNNFTVPAVSGCEKIGGVIAVDPAINDKAGLPAAAGASAASIEYEISSAPVGEIDANYTADQVAGDAPLAVHFDASASKSKIVNYSWDFGDGSPVVDTTEKTVDHTYSDFGTYQPELTVTRANSESDSLQGDEIVVDGAITTITEEAAELSNEPSPAFAFSSDTNPATFECSIDSGAWTSCSSPNQVGPLADGDHTFDVRASHLGSVGHVVSATPFTIDTAKPVVTIDSAPDVLIGTGVTDGSVEFSADDPSVDFSCRYDAAPGDQFLPCISPKDISWAAADGDHKFEVKATDDLGNVSDVAEADWSVDVTAPSTILASHPVDPNGFSDDSRAAFDFDSSEPGSDFICKFNDGAERPCDSGVEAGTGDQGGQDRLGNPVEGNNTFTVWAVDQAGNRDPVGATYSYDFVGEQPAISVISGPSGSTTSASASVVFQSDNQDVTAFECRDTAAGGSWAACDPGMINPRLGKAELAGLAEGQHSLEIRGVNAIGAESKGDNVATVDWKVDNTPPSISIASGPDQGSFTNSDSASFSFGSDEDDATFSCRLDGAGSWSDCANPLELTGLSDNSHSLRVRAVDSAGNVSDDPVERSWSVGQPGVTLDSTPAAVSPSASNTFQFSGTAPFECRLDPSPADNANGTGWSSCTSPKTYPGLSDGSHLFQVRSNVGFPTSHTWIVDATGPVVTFDSAPAAHTGLAQNSADIEFSASDPNGAVSFECRYFESSVTPPPWDPCTSPQSVSWDETDDGTTMKFQARSTSPVGNIGPVASTEWTIESTNPTVTIGPDVAGWDGTTGTGGFDTASSDRPAPTTKIAAPQFRMSSSKPFAGANFACQLNGGDVVSPCGANGNPGTVILALTGPDALGQSPLEGENTFNVWAVDSGGNVSDASDSYTWTQDTNAPTLSFTSDNPVVTNSNDLHVTFSSDEAVKAVDGFKCRLDGSSGSDDPIGWANCDTMIDPQSGEWVGATLTKGQHKLDVKGIDALDNRQVAGSGLRYKFTINRAIPSTVISAQPVTPTAENHASFTFAANPTASGIAGYECQIDGGAWASCSSPTSYNALADGAHTFDVRATDKAGNVEDPPAEATWTVDSSLPVVTLSDDLPGAVTSQDSVSFGLAVVPGDSALECRLIGPGQTEGTVNWATCGATKAYSDLADGGFEFQARGTNSLGTVGAVESKTWTVDTTAPVVGIDSGPSGPTNNASPSFAFTSDGSGTFSCKLDADGATGSVPNAACTSPVSFTDLADGGYTVTVVQTDGAGNSSTPATRHFTVDTVAPAATITAGPDPSTEATSADFEFNSDEAGSSFTCTLDGGTSSACTSPQSFGTVAVGEHTFKVKATDAAGNVGSDASRTWTVKERTPTTCAEGQTGTPPNCVTPPPEECEPPQTGTPPNCVSPPAPGKLAKPVVKGPKKVKAGKTLKIKVKVANKGESTLAKVKVCLKTPKKLVKGKSNRCKTVKKLRAGKSAVVAITLKTKSGKKLIGKKVKVTATVSGDGAKAKKRGHVTVLK